MECKGTAVVTLPEFVKKEFGTRGLSAWLDRLPPKTASVLEAEQVRVSRWYNLEDFLTVPMKALCDLFYDGRSEGAYQAGRFSAEYALRGIYRTMLKFGSPQWTIKRGSRIIQLYYRPSKLETVVLTHNRAVVKIQEFPDMNIYVEKRIQGWLLRASELCGLEKVNLKVTKSMVRGDTTTELDCCWT